MSFQYHTADFIQRCLDRLDLAEDVDAIGVFFDHALIPHVPFDILQPA
jgi:hypothetical protein